MMVLLITIKERNWQICRYPFLVFLAVLLMTGCATSQPDVIEKRASIDTLIKQADIEMGKGRKEQSITILNQAAKENPTSMVPWLRIANIWFNALNYPSAILAANEVLLRDSENQEAKSILVVAGLRVAASAITGLIPQNPVNPSARAEAEELTKALRTALGEKVLVPAPVAATVSAPKASRASARSSRTRPAPVVRSTPTAAPERQSVTATKSRNSPSTASVSTNSGGSDPFKSLK